MNVLVTGAAGYLGSVLCKRLIGADHNVVALDDLSGGPARLHHLVPTGRFRFVRGDAGDRSLLRTLLGEADAVVPLAGVVGQQACAMQPNRAEEVNVEAVKLLLELRSKDQRVVFPATNSGYGTKSGEVSCTEETPLEPVSWYGETKVTAEKLVLEEPNTVSLRFATLFGISPKMRWDLLVNFYTRRCWQGALISVFDKDFRRNFCHVEDAAEAIRHFLITTATGAFNVGMPECPTKWELADSIRKRVGRGTLTFSESETDPDRRNYVVSVAKAAAAGFRTVASLEEGVDELQSALLMEA